MTPLTLSELGRAGFAVTLVGGRLRLSAPVGRLTPDLRECIAYNRNALLAALTLRARLIRLANAERLPADLADGLSDADVDACAGLPDDTVQAYLRLVNRSRIMDAGMVPEDYTKAAHCHACGPVWLWPGAPAILAACPWCHRRKLGRSIPRPECTHG